MIGVLNTLRLCKNSSNFKHKCYGDTDSPKSRLARPDILADSLKLKFKLSGTIKY